MSVKFNITEAKRSGFYLGGSPGSGKTNTAQNFSKLLMDDGIIVYVFDISQAWQVKSSIPNFVTVDKLPVILNFPANQSIIFDLSMLYVEEQKMAVANICKALFSRQVKLPEEKRKWIFLIFEEAQIYLQQNSMRSKAASEIMRLITVGRNYKIRFGLITQFPSTIDKLPIKAIRQRYFGYTDEKNDKAYIEAFIGKEKAEELKTLKTGEFMLNLGNLIERVQFAEFKSTTVPQKLVCQTEPNTISVKANPSEDNTALKAVLYAIGITLTIIFLVYVYTHTTTQRGGYSIILPLINLLFR